MCGLYASVGIRPERGRLQRVAHRGPDGERWLTFDTPTGPLALGHRRLAIIDLTDQASQPMSTPDQQQFIIFNGEIYNYKELRAELMAQGISFTTRSDCEVLLMALRHWGLAVLPRLRGMFSFIFYDKAAESLTAVRDGYGIKPLCYNQTDDGIAFASEHKQIFDLPGSNAKLNVSQVIDYLHAQTTDHAPQTLFTNVMNLAPGHLITLDLSQPLNQHAVLQVRWFDVPSLHRPTDSFAHEMLQFRELFEQSIDRHLRADVSVGACLSGGLDSSYIVAMASQKAKQSSPIHTFTAVFPGEPIDERKFAEEVNRSAGSIGHFVEISDQALAQSVEKIVWHQDEPFGSTSIFAQYFVFQAIAEAGLKVVLDGQGADEQLAGYHGIFPFHNAALIKQGRFVELAQHIIGLKKHHGIPISDFFKQLGTHFLAQVGISNKKQGRHPDPLARGQIAQFQHASGSTLQAIVAREGLPHLESIGEFCLAMMMGGNLQMLLRYEDRNSMAHSVEARVPFLDSDLAAFSLGLGDRYKLVKGVTKYIAREAMAEIVPTAITQRHSKLGFAAPETRWLRGPLRGHVEAGMEAACLRFPSLLDWEAARLMHGDLVNSQGPVDPMLWRLSNLGLWAEKFDVSA